MKVRYDAVDKQYQKLVDDVWEDITDEEAQQLIKDGAEEIPFEEDDIFLGVELEIDDRNLTQVGLIKNKSAIEFRFGDDSEVYDTAAAELYFNWINDALKTNRVEFIDKVYNDITVKEIKEDDSESEREATSIPAEDSTEDTTEDFTEESEENDTTSEFNAPEFVGDFYTFISDKKNPLDSKFVEAMVSDEGSSEVLGGQSFTVHELQMPFSDTSTTLCRILIGKIDNGNGVFICIPEEWQTVSSLDKVEDYEKINQGVNLQAIVSEDMVIENPEDFYQDLGDFYAKGVAYSEKPIEEPAEEPTEDSIEDTTEEPEENLDTSEPIPADVTSIDDGINFESTPIRYRTSLNESWMNGFFVTEGFIQKVRDFENKLSMSLRKSLKEAVNIVLAESGKFIAVRVDKKSIMESSLSVDWFKKRLTKVCGAIKRCSGGLQIVETRGSYYTRTFFMTEASEKNYVISEDYAIPEVSFIQDKGIFESKDVTFRPEFIAAVNEALNKEFSYVVRPVITSNGKVVESYKVSNDNKVPYIIRINEEAPRIVFVSKDIVPVNQPIPDAIPDQEPPKEVEPPECVDGEEALYDGTQAAAIASKVAPIMAFPIKLEDLYATPPSEVVASVGDFIEESDNTTGIHTGVSVKEVEVGGAVFKILVCSVYDMVAYVIPAILVSEEVMPVFRMDDYAIVDNRGFVHSFGYACDRFLKIMAVKYLS